jgi:hypothetical protein
MKKQKVDEAELLEKLAEHYQFAQFVVLGLIPGTADEDSLMVITSPHVSPFNALWLMIEGMQYMLPVLSDQEPSLH